MALAYSSLSRRRAQKYLDILEASNSAELPHRIPQVLSSPNFQYPKDHAEALLLGLADAQTMLRYKTAMRRGEFVPLEARRLLSTRAISTPAWVKVGRAVNDQHISSCTVEEIEDLVEGCIFMLQARVEQKVPASIAAGLAQHQRDEAFQATRGRRMTFSTYRL